MQWIELTRREQPAANFRLRTASGEAVTRAQFRHRKHLILVFLPTTGLAEFLQAFAARMDDFEQASAAIYGVTVRAAPENPSMPLLLDADGQVRRSYAAALPAEQRLTGDEALIAIVDRYGVLAYLGSADDDAAAAVDETLTRVWGIEYECPE